MNQNYNLNNDFNSDINNNSIKNKTLNNFYKKENFIGYNNFINTNKNLALNQNMRKVNSPSSNDIEKLKNKIQRLSSGIVRPSNKMFKI